MASLKTMRRAELVLLAVDWEIDTHGMTRSQLIEAIEVCAAKDMKKLDEEKSGAITLDDVVNAPVTEADIAAAVETIVPPKEEQGKCDTCEGVGKLLICPKCDKSYCVNCRKPFCGSYPDCQHCGYIFK